jgi:hypothetical protein
MTDEKKPDRKNRDLALFRKPGLPRALRRGLGRNEKSKLTRYLSRPLMLEEAGPPRILAQLLVILSVTIGAGVVWAAVTEITETAIAHGQIMPAGSLHHVEHLEGGIVAEVLVEDGEVVASGQTLMRLRSSEARAERDRQRAREANLSLRAERLRAFVLDRDPDFSAGQSFPGLRADQQAILDLQREARESQRTVLLSRIDQRRVELDGLEERKQNLQAQIDITAEQVGMRRNLVKKGLDSRVNLLDSERKLTEIRGDLLGVMGEMSRTRETLHEAEGALAELDAKIRLPRFENRFHAWKIAWRGSMFRPLSPASSMASAPAPSAAWWRRARCSWRSCPSRTIWSRRSKFCRATSAICRSANRHALRSPHTMSPSSAPSRVSLVTFRPRPSRTRLETPSSKA